MMTYAVYKTSPDGEFKALQYEAGLHTRKVDLMISRAEQGIVHARLDIEAESPAQAIQRAQMTDYRHYAYHLTKAAIFVIENRLDGQERAITL